MPARTPSSAPPPPTASSRRSRTRAGHSASACSGTPNSTSTPATRASSPPSSPPPGRRDRTRPPGWRARRRADRQMAGPRGCREPARCRTPADRAPRQAQQRRRRASRDVRLARRHRRRRRCRRRRAGAHKAVALPQAGRADDDASRPAGPPDRVRTPAARHAPRRQRRPARPQQRGVAAADQRRRARPKAGTAGHRPAAPLPRARARRGGPARTRRAGRRGDRRGRALRPHRGRAGQPQGRERLAHDQPARRQEPRGAARPRPSRPVGGAADPGRLRPVPARPAAARDGMRIVAGRWRGRALTAPPGTATRPTSDRARQAIFDMLLHAAWGGRDLIEGSHVLDAFAGTGAMGLEALSRGAAHATFIERDPAALAALRRNVAVCRADADILAADACAPPAGRPCRLVFLDPPYGQDLVPRAAAALAAAGWFAPGAIVVAETARSDALSWPESLGPDVLDERTYGAARVSVRRVGDATAPQAIACGA